MQKADTLIRTKLRLPFVRPGLVLRPRLQEQLSQGLRSPLTLITAPAGFGKTTLVASCAAACSMPVAWLSVDKNDNEMGRFLSYLVAAFQEAEDTLGSEAAQLMAGAHPVLPEAVLTGLVNDLDATGRDVVLVLDDYQFITSRTVHEGMAFLLEHCPRTLHVVIATRSDPPLPITRLRARGQAVELRAADLRFTRLEAGQFLNEVMMLGLDEESVAALESRTEGWIAGLQMAALSMRDRKDVARFIESFSGTNRFILDYLLEEVLAGQSPEVQRFLLYTSLLERLTAPLCDTVLAPDQGSKREGDATSTPSETSRGRSAAILEYLDRANLFLVPLDDERQWYRYHHLFADLLRAQLQNSIGAPGVMQLHLRASEWHEQNGSTLDAIHHASLASDSERIERLIEQNYIEMVNRREMSGVRFWMGKLSQEVICRRPWLCLYEAFSRSWFGQLEEARLLLDLAEKRIRDEMPAEAHLPDIQAMLGYHAYVKSRVTAMQGDTRTAIQQCLAARENIPAGNLGLQIETGITLGYEYFLHGDFESANRVLHETIRLCNTVRAINNPVAACALLARIQVIQGRLYEAHDLYQKAAGLIHEAGDQYVGALGLAEVGIAALLCEWNDLEGALVRIRRGLDCLPFWGKADDFCLAYATLSRIQFARGNQVEGAAAIEKASQLIQTCGVFSEARSVVETSRARLLLARGDRLAVDRWAAELEKRFGSPAPLRYEDELTHIMQARVFLAQNNPDEAVRLLSCLEESARTGGREGRLIEILILKAMALGELRSKAAAGSALTESLRLAEPGGYVRIFLDEGRPMQGLLAQWVTHACAGLLQDYAVRLLAQFASEPVHTCRRAATRDAGTPAQEKASTFGGLAEPLSQRELEVLQLIALGKTNQEIAEQLIVSPGTVKAHAASIYRKLDVANRTEAVARARQLYILT